MLEDLKHFLLWCPAYEEEKRQNFCLRKPYVEEEELTIGKILFDKENVQEAKVTLLQFWKIREKKRNRKPTQTVRDTSGSAVTKTTLPTLNLTVRRLFASIVIEMQHIHSLVLLHQTSELITSLIDHVRVHVLLHNIPILQ